jgi:hypothetical protein
MKAKIISNRTRMLGDSMAVALQVEAENGEPHEVLIFVTEKAANMARRQLKIAGFDVDARDLEELDANPRLLAGRVVPLKFEVFRGKTQARIDMDTSADGETLARGTSLLRNAKKEAGPSSYDDVPPPGDDEIPF